MASCPECNSEISEGAEVCIHCGAKFNGAGSSSQNVASSTPAKSSPGTLKSANPGPLKISLKKDTPLKPAIKDESNPSVDSEGILSDNESTEDHSTDITTTGILDKEDSPSESASVSAGVSTSSLQSARNKWLEEQNKIKSELEALKGKLSSEFKIDTPKSFTERPGSIFELDDNKFQEVRDASIGLSSLKRPLTPEEEQKKEELISEINDLRNEGYDVSRLDRIVDIDPTSAWQEFVKFMDDIEVLQKLRTRYSELDTTGFSDESESIRNKLDNPDLIHQIERELDNLEELISSGSAAEDKGGLQELIAAGKEAFKSSEYQKALNFYKSALKIDPNNREVEFYRRKTEAKLQALSSMNEGVGAAPAAGGFAPQPAGIPATKTSVSPKPMSPTAAPASGRTAVKPAAVRIQTKAAVKPTVQTGAGGTAPVRSSIPTGANVEVKQPLSVSMTPKMPTKGTGVKTGIKKPAPGIKSKKLAVKKPGVGAVKPGIKVKPRPAAPTPAPAPARTLAPAPAAPAPKPASGNPAEVEALGFNAFINKEYQKALEYYEQVLALDPNFPGAKAQRDKCLEFLGK